MSNDRVIRVYPEQGMWVVKKDGSPRAIARKDTKEEAYKRARAVALREGYDIVVHWQDGKIQKRVRPKDSEQDDCFITTACVRYYQLTDDCIQLRTLRIFRDDYLLKSEENRKLVDQYYLLAPALVKKLNNSDNRPELYKEIFSQINLACRKIHANDLEGAKRIYVHTVNWLANHFA